MRFRPVSPTSRMPDTTIWLDLASLTREVFTPMAPGASGQCCPASGHADRPSQPRPLHRGPGQRGWSWWTARCCWAGDRARTPVADVRMLDRFEFFGWNRAALFAAPLHRRIRAADAEPTRPCRRDGERRGSVGQGARRAPADVGSRGRGFGHEHAVAVARG